MTLARPEPRAATSDAMTVAPEALYVHVPFCVALCPYCDFVVYPGAAARGARSRIAGFVAALLREIDLRADAADAAFGRPTSREGSRRPLESLYLGGGTPSLLPADLVDAIIGRVRDRFGISPGAEVTLEANPGPTERGDLSAARSAGVTRVSFGAQSLDATELRRLGRRHSPTDVAEAVAEARAAGLASVNLDLLYDVPGQTEASWGASLDAALALGPDHLSLYALTLDDAGADDSLVRGDVTSDQRPVPLGARRWRGRAAREQDEDRAAAQYEAAVSRLAAGGWHGYEISNWARPGHESRHNLAYWRRRPHEAAGPGAHAFDGHTRRWNAASLDGYLAALDGGRLPPGGATTLDADSAASEVVILGLRTDEGILGETLADPRFARALAWAAANGLTARERNGRVRLTTRGRLLSNELFARLI